MSTAGDCCSCGEPIKSNDDIVFWTSRSSTACDFSHAACWKQWVDFLALRGEPACRDGIHTADFARWRTDKQQEAWHARYQIYLNELRKAGILDDSKEQKEILATTKPEMP